jgi:hypothetical protein
MKGKSKKSIKTLITFSSGARWTLAQMLMQKSKLGLHNPIGRY